MTETERLIIFALRNTKPHPPFNITPSSLYPEHLVLAANLDFGVRMTQWNTDRFELSKSLGRLDSEFQVERFEQKTEEPIGTTVLLTEEDSP